MNIEWDPYAIEDWQRLGLEDAARVARAVQQWAQSGAGLVEVTEGAGVYRLYAGRYVVRFLVDSTTDTMHVVQIVRRRKR